MKKAKNKYIIISAILLILSLVSISMIVFGNKKEMYKPYSEFLKDVSNKNIITVFVNNSSFIDVKLKDGVLYKTDNPRSNNFKEELLKQNIEVSEKSPNTLKDMVPSVVLGVSLLSILFIVLKNSKVSSRAIGSVDALDVNAIKDYNFNFGSMAGNEEAKESVKDIVDFLKDPKKYERYGARIPRGIILYGEPGTGKTLLAKAVAGEANVPFYAMSGSDFVQVYVGVGASRIRSLFKKAKAQGKAVIFIDEIDAIGKKRDSSKAGSSDERDQTLNALLTEMSGFNENDGIVIMAATNRLDMLDPALLRPGRFDRHIEVSLPDKQAREEILKLHLKNKPFKQISFNEWAQKTSYFSGAKLENLVNEAAIIACKENSEYINNFHMEKAFSIVLAGYEKINRSSIKDEDKKITAYHEAGHALVSLMALPQDKISKITIIPTSKGAGGYTLSIPEDRAYQSLDYLKKRVMVLLGGRAAEELIFGKEKITTGAYSDIKQGTKIITDMITEYGMGESLGLINLSEASRFNNLDSKVILEECKSTLDDLYEKTKNILKHNENILDKIAQVLIEKETITYKELNFIIEDQC